jgi:TolB-like protein/class 3 adenylate cyclase
LAEPIQIKRRLAAIFAADVEGYSLLMGTDEVATLDALNAHREVLDGLIAKHNGRIANTAGDSVLAEFGSAVDAVRCAMEVQGALATANSTLPESRQVNFRIGVHVGDVMVRAGDLFGDGVNIAARLQTLARAGGLCVSGVTYDQVRKILPLKFTDLGAQTVKNIEEPIRAYKVEAHGNESALKEISRGDRRPLALPDKPSIAVLPFQNMSGDPEQEYFADGMVEEITTALSRFKLLFVIARNSSFTYKGKSVDIMQVGRELGVRYVLEGSVRKAGGRVRITGQLIDAANGAHLWADRFDSALEDVFELQDRVTGSVVAAIAPKVQQAELERSRRKPTESLDAYDYYLRGAALYANWTKEANEEALGLFSKAIELDPSFASPYATAARCYSMRKGFGWMVDPPREIAEANRLARTAVRLGADDAFVLGASAFAIGYVVGDLDGCAAYVDRALSLNPNQAGACGVAGWINILLGKPDVGITHALHAMRLSPLDPSFGLWQLWTATGHFFAERDEEAVTWAKAALLDRPDNPNALVLLAMSQALLGLFEEAKKTIAHLYEVFPVSRLSDLNVPLRRPQDHKRRAEAWRLLGLSE